MAPILQDFSLYFKRFASSTDPRNSAPEVDGGQRALGHGARGVQLPQGHQVRHELDPHVAAAGRAHDLHEPAMSCIALP